MHFQISKNASCPCSSGEKYKKCCLGKLSDDKEKYYGLLHKQNKIKDKLLKWASHNLSKEELDEYSYEFNNKSFEENNYENELFGFFDWLFIEAVHKTEGRKIIDVIINEFYNLFEEDELIIMQEWVGNTQAGIFEVQEVDKNEWRILIKEIFTNKEYLIRDRLASLSIIKGDIFFGRVQMIFSDYYLSGVATNYPRFQIAEQVKKFIGEKYAIEKNKNSSLTYEYFINNKSEIINSFIPKKPKFITGEGEEASLCEAIYSVDLEHIDEILDVLNKNKDFIITSLDYNKKFKSVTIDYIKKQKNFEDDKNESAIKIFSNYIDEKGNKIESLGNINIEKNYLKVFSISERVYNEITKKLKDNFGEYIKLKKEEIKSAGEVMEEIEDKEEIEGEESYNPDKKDIQLKRVKEEFLQEYYKNWCDAKIPLLNNNTPRQAMKTEEGRKLLKSLLLDFDNMEQHKKIDGEDYFPGVELIRKELNFYE